MNHPPIPPNCNHFVEHTFRLHISELATRFVPIETANVHYEKPIIAAVACYFWEKEQDRRMKELEVYEDADSCLSWDGFIPNVNHDEFDRRRRLVWECGDNARLWKLWEGNNASSDSA